MIESSLLAGIIHRVIYQISKSRFHGDILASRRAITGNRLSSVLPSFRDPHDDIDNARLIWPETPCQKQVAGSRFESFP
jgi:hypothetical protein